MISDSLLATVDAPVDIFTVHLAGEDAVFAALEMRPSGICRGEVKCVFTSQVNRE